MIEQDMKVKLDECSNQQVNTISWVSNLYLKNVAGCKHLPSTNTKYQVNKMITFDNSDYKRKNCGI